MHQNRRTFIKQAGQLAAGATLFSLTPGLLSSCAQEGTSGEQGETREAEKAGTPFTFGISLAAYSFHRAIANGELTNLDLPVKAKQDFGLDAIELLSRDFKGQEEDPAYLEQLNKICDDQGVKRLLIMVDDEGDLGDLDEAARTQAVENHHKWVRAAKALGCHSIRVNAAGKGTREEVASAAVDGLGRLSDYAAGFDINVIVENHGGYSSDGSWLADVLTRVGKPNCGALPDFGNVCVTKTEGNSHPDGASICDEEYDRYQLLRDLMPFAKAISAKSHGFDEQGNELHTDYKKMLQIVKEFGYNGYIGIEYEGNILSEPEGIMATKRLLERVREELA